jgi:antirestriction protein ArdC
MNEIQKANWLELLVDAVNKPGRLLEAYTAFHDYSLGNALLALSQCYSRSLTPGPLNTYKGWQTLGRQVRRGESAITLCMPITAKRRVRVTDSIEEKYEEQVRTMFVYRQFWFVLSQTVGDKPYVQEIPNFDIDTALQKLDITRVEFDALCGNVQGFALRRCIAINPVAQLPYKTMFHEIAHIVLGHTGEQQTMIDGETTPRNLREVEAESVALICCEALGLPGAEYCRGYVQHWLREAKEVPGQCAQRIFVAATAILKAGQRMPEEVACTRTNE